MNLLNLTQKYLYREYCFIPKNTLKTVKVERGWREMTISHKFKENMSKSSLISKFLLCFASIFIQ